MSENGKTELPTGWAWTTIGEVTESIVDQSGPSGIGDFLYVDISSIDNKAKKIVFAKSIPIAQAPSRARQRLRAGDVVVSMTRPNLNAVAMVPVNMECAIGSTGLHVLRTNTTNPAWLYYLVQTEAFINAMSGLVLGVLYPAVRPKDIRAYTIPLASLPEQHCIIAEIEKQFTRLDAGVVVLERVRANLKRYRASVLKAACEGRLVPTEADLARAEGRDYEPADQLLARILKERRAKWEADQLAKMQTQGKVPKDDKWKEKYQEPVEPDTTNFPELPEGWAWMTVDAMLAEPLCNGISVKGSDTPPGVAALKLNAMSERGFKYQFVRYLPIDEKLAKDLEVVAGDFFVSRGNGSLDLVGRGTLAQDPPFQVVFPDTMIRLRFLEIVKSSVWVSTIWPAKFVRRQIERRVKTTAGIWKIAQPEVASVKFPFPPLAEQHRIVAEVERRLSVIDELEAVITANLKRAERLRQSILKRAFEGKLVPQDPNDEPASALLERMRAERTSRVINNKVAEKTANKTESKDKRQQGVGVQRALFN